MGTMETSKKDLVEETAENTTQKHEHMEKCEKTRVLKDRGNLYAISKLAIKEGGKKNTWR